MPIVVVRFVGFVGELACQQVRRGFHSRNGLGGIAGLGNRGVWCDSRLGRRGVGRVTRAVLRFLGGLFEPTRTLDLVVGHGPEV
jgi:hypothetical protein|tara:strand:+ start:549 stop:800 length:252 start_codon:yes stop_codon:yes gene_type:complete